MHLTTVFGAGGGDVALGAAWWRRRAEVVVAAKVAREDGRRVLALQGGGFTRPEFISIADWFAVSVHHKVVVHLDLEVFGLAI